MLTCSLICSLEWTMLNERFKLTKNSWEWWWERWWNQWEQRWTTRSQRRRWGRRQVRYIWQKRGGARGRKWGRRRRLQDIQRHRKDALQHSPCIPCPACARADARCDPDSATQIILAVLGTQQARPWQAGRVARPGSTVHFARLAPDASTCHMASSRTGCAPMHRGLAALLDFHVSNTMRRPWGDPAITIQEKRFSVKV